MSHHYRHYRQVTIINNSQQSSPQIDGFEEIICDGKRQVYSWNNLTDLLQGDDSEFWDSSLIDTDNNGLNRDEISPRVRYLNPDEVIVRDLTYPQRKKQHQALNLSQIKTSIITAINPIKRIAKRVPLALNAAWRELTRED